MDEDNIKAVLDEVCNTFSQLDMQAWFDCFHRPCMIVTPNGAHCLQSFEDCENLMGPTFSELMKKEFVQSTLDDYKIKIISPYFAVASAIWSRFNKHGECFQRFGVSYGFNKIDSVWKICNLTSHSANSSIL